MPTNTDHRARHALVAALAGALIAGCGPSQRETQNRREFEALLTAVSLRDGRELELDAGRIAARHSAGELSDAGFADLSAIIDQARGGDWAGAERRAYDLRARRPYFR